MQPKVDLINSILPIFNASYDSDSTITFMIPLNLIPSVLQIVCFYYFSPTLIEVSLTFKNASWKKPLIKFSAINPYFQQNYIGRPLIYEKIRYFFTETYVPKSNYRSLDFLTSYEKVDHITSLFYFWFSNSSTASLIYKTIAASATKNSHLELSSNQFVI